MRTLRLVPERTYTVGFGPESVATAGDGVPSLVFRNAERHASRTLDATFLCDPAQHAYLRAFDRLTGLGAEWFQVGLMVDDRTLGQYKARILPGSLHLTKVEGDLHTMAARLEAMWLNPADDISDEFDSLAAQGITA